MRIRTRHVRGQRPFSSKGVSLYLASGDADPGDGAIVYRRHQLAAGLSLHGARTSPGGTGTAKGNRVAFAADPAASMSYAIPAALAGKYVRVQLRACDSDIECETILRSMLVKLDGSRVEVVGIRGTGRLIRVQPRSGGVCRVFFRYDPDVSGLQPTQFGYAPVSGSGVTAAVVPSFRSEQQLYDMDLTCAGSTTIDVTAVNGAVSLVLFRVTILPDLSGPSAPTSLVARTV